MLIDTLRVFVSEPFLEIFYGEKKFINVLTVFSIYY